MQRQGQDSTSEAPAGQRTIPKFERHTHMHSNIQDTKVTAVEGIEKPLKALAIQ